jgi:putative CocE/NonD family hydrolase
MRGETRAPGPRLVALAAAALIAARAAPAQDVALPLPPADLADSSALAASIPRLAARVLDAYRNDDRRARLDDRFRLQLAAGRFDEAARTIAELRALRTGADSTAQARAANAQYEIEARARALHAADGSSLADAFARAFRETMTRLDDRTAALVARQLTCGDGALASRACAVPILRDELRRAIARQEGKREIPLRDALALVRSWQALESHRPIAALAPPLVAADDERRYIITRDVRIRTPDGATVCALVVRPRSARGRLPALLEFTIYADPVPNLDEARRSASNGYAGVSALARGKGCAPDAPVPFEHDGADAAAVIEWIAAQPWSDGRVGMFGGSYNGFAQWAAAGRMPRALRAIMPSVAVVPGLDVPMEGGVFQAFFYPWPLFAASGKWLDTASYNDRRRWNRLWRELYVRGRAWRDLPAIDGAPNRFYSRWLEHPTYDAYWQGMIPQGEAFARIGIPVLTTTGYCDGAQPSALHYLAEHHRHRPDARHHLLIGPYDHISGQRGTVTVLGEPVGTVCGETIDPVAHIDLGELRYQWFDHVLRGGARPALLRDRINFQVMGANRWRHVPSLDAMSTDTLRFHLSAARAEAGDAYRLVTTRAAPDSSVVQTVDLADRSDIDRAPPDTGLDTWNGVRFDSDPLDAPVEISGRFSGLLDVETNKRDFDLTIGLFAVTPSGQWHALSYLVARASHLRDLRARTLLEPGRRVRLPVASGRLTSRTLPAGSRLVALITVNKHPWAQVNYGTGKDVSDETIADAGEPLRIHWYGSSHIDIPVSR